MKRLARLLPVAFLAALAVASPLSAEDPAPGDPAAVGKSLAANLKNLYLAEGLQADQVTLFPIYVLGEEVPLEVVPMVPDAPFNATEPEKSTAVERLRVMNPGPKVALLSGGTVIDGGRRDRVVVRDVLIPPADAREVDVMAASMAADTRKTPVDFKVREFLAPPYIRENLLVSTSKSIVPKFVSHFLDFLPESDKRRSLSAISESDNFAEYCLVCQSSMSAWPTKQGGGTVVGSLAVVRGRVQALEVYATNKFVSEYFEPMLKSLTFPAAALELRAKSLGIKLPKGDEASLKMATDAANKMLAELRTATFTPRKQAADAVGISFDVKLKDGTVGDAIALDGRLVHMALFPRDVFEHSLYGKPLEPLEKEDTGDESDEEKTVDLGTSERREEGSGDGRNRISDSEKRILERVKPRR